MRLIVIVTHQVGIAIDIGSQNRRQPAFRRRFDGCGFASHDTLRP